MRVHTYEINLTTLLVPSPELTQLCLRFSPLSRFYSIYIFILCSSSRAVAVVSVIIAAACLCMPENKANACTRLIAIATSERQRERERRESANQFLITKNAKYTIERKNTRERELLSAKQEMSKYSI